MSDSRRPRPSQLAPTLTREGRRGVSPDRVSGSGEAAVARGARRRRPNQSGETDTSSKSLRSDKSQRGVGSRAGVGFKVTDWG